MADSTSLPLSTSMSRSTHGDVEVSPPTSADGPSSQEPEFHRPQMAKAPRPQETPANSRIWSGNARVSVDRVKEAGRMDSRAPQMTLVGSTTPGREASRPSSSVNAGSKRTASGAVKSAHSRSSPSKRSKRTNVDHQRLSAEKISEVSRTRSRAFKTALTQGCSYPPN